MHYHHNLMLLLCFLPPVCLVCLNHEVMVFHTRTSTAPDLGSIAMFARFYYISPHPTCFNRCSGYFSFPLYHTASPSVSICHSISSLLHPLPNSYPGVKLCPHHMMYVIPCRNIVEISYPVSPVVSYFFQCYIVHCNKSAFSFPRRCLRLCHRILIPFIETVHIINIKIHPHHPI